LAVQYQKFNLFWKLIMEKNDLARILIVDDEPAVCGFLENAIEFFGMQPKTINRSLEVAAEIKMTFYNIVLLDVFMPEKSGLELIEDFKEHSPETKIVMVTGRADTETAIQALRLGAFDFLEKPIDMELLSHTLNRALEVQKTEREFIETRRNLELTQERLLAKKDNLENAKKELLSAIEAKKVVMREIKSRKADAEKRVVFNIESMVIPIIEALQNDPDLAGYRPKLSILISHLESLVAGLPTQSDIDTSLSTSELHIASLIMSGLTSQEIAECTFISESTVKTHRRNLRKKLGIDNNQDLRQYLLTLTKHDSDEPS
jgi:DNA-binding NarL/FixJ family response regulator